MESAHTLRKSIWGLLLTGIGIPLLVGGLQVSAAARIAVIVTSTPTPWQQQELDKTFWFGVCIIVLGVAAIIGGVTVLALEIRDGRKANKSDRDTQLQVAEVMLDAAQAVREQAGAAPAEFVTTDPKRPLKELYERGVTMRVAEISRLMFGEKTQAERMPIFIEKYQLWRQDVLDALSDAPIQKRDFAAAADIPRRPDWLTPDDIAIPLECLRGIINGAEGWKL